VIEGYSPRIFMDDGKGGTGDVKLSRDSETTGYGLGQSGLAGPQFPIETQYVAGYGALPEETTEGLSSSDMAKGNDSFRNFHTDPLHEKTTNPFQEQGCMS
jgi:hypothetical protein